MARDRSIKLIIQAQVDGAKRALQETATAAKKVGDEADGASKRASTAGGRMVQSARENADAWTTAGTTIAGFGAVAVAGFGAATAAHSTFEKSMSGVKAVANASASEMDALAESALEMGAATAFSASEAAVAQGELARAGVSVADILGGALKGSMDLAAAGGLELADAAVISAQAMNLFNLEGKDVPRIADVLASAANKSAADVSDLGQAMQQAGTVASQTGLSLEETAAALAMFADQGIRGSDAGTSLKTMLQRLTPQSKEAQQVMDDLGFSAYDAQGNFIGLEGLAGELQESFGGLDTESRNAALGVAFGSDAIRGAAILMEGGAEAAREYEAAMHDQGAAAEMAATQMDNLAGDWEEFAGAMETALIKGGSGANDLLRGMVTGATDLVNVYNGMPGAVQGGLTALSGVVGTAAVAVGGIALAVPKMVEFRDSMSKLAEISPRADRAVRGVGRAAGWAAGGAAVGMLLLGLSELGDRMLDSERSAADLENALVRLGENGFGRSDLDDLFGDVSGIEDFNAELERLANPDTWQKIGRGVGDAGNNLLSFATFGKDGRTESARLREELERLSPVLAGMDADAASDGFVDLADRMHLTRDGAADLLNLLPEYRESLVGVATEMGVAATDANLLAIAYGEIGPEAEAAAAGAAELTPEMEAQKAVADEAAQALAEYQAELAGISASFVDSSGAYAAATEAAQAWAQGVADGTASAEDSWETYVGEFTGTKDEYLAELRRMSEAQSEWEANLLGLIARGVPAEFVSHLAEMGPAAADEVALVSSMTDEELAEWVSIMEARGGEGVGAFATSLTDANTLAVLAAAGEQLGDEALSGLIEKLLTGKITAQEAVSEYDLKVDLDLETEQATAEADAFVAETSGKTATAPLDTDTTPAREKAQQWVWDTELHRPVPLMDTDTTPADEKAQEWEYDTNLMRPVPKMDADPTEANAKARTWRDYAQSQRPQPYIDANDTPARGIARGWRDWASGLLASAGVTAKDRGAWSAARGIVNSISSMWAYINVGSRFMGSLNVGGADRTRNSAVYTGGVRNRASGGFVAGHAPHIAGPAYGVTDLYRMGLDGLLTHYAESNRGLTKELYLSDHPAYRTQNIDYLRTGASWFGYDIVKKAYAAGGLSQRLASPSLAYTSPAAAQSGPVTAVLAAQDRELLAAVASRPVSVRVGSREVARATREGEQSWGARSTWGHETTTLPGGGRL